VGRLFKSKTYLVVTAEHLHQ
jgi:hypothetical protein